MRIFFVFLILFVTANIFAGISNDPQPAASVKTKPLAEGKYTGTAKGYSGDITVEVEALSGKIKDKITSQKESRPKTALKSLPEAVVKKQSADNIDAVSGATYTSKGFLQAVKNALEKASKN